MKITTVAWDLQVLAADRAQFERDIIISEAPKVHRRTTDGALIAHCGNGSLAAAFTRWFLEGEQGDRPSLGDTEDKSAECLIIRPNGTSERHDMYGWHHFQGKTAMGAGQQLALGAMDAGAGAVTAVHLATQRIGGDPNAIDALPLREPKQEAAA